MNKIQKTIASAVAASAVLVQLAAPALATEIVITNNGSGADNYATVVETSTTTVSQSNVANVTNNVDADANTGNNGADFNTGGSTVVKSGDAATSVTVTNELNSNVADLDCCDNTSGTSVKIDGNGAKTDNTVALTNVKVTALNQDNVANVLNNVNADANTGKNGADLNTNGDVLVSSGKASSTVAVSTKANTNFAVVGSPLGGLPTSATSFIISDNGAYSDNFINATLVKTSSLDQDNLANVVNDVDADAKTSHNGADFNTGGDVYVLSGDAATTASVSNDVNFNYASLNCECAGWDVLAKINGNGASAGNHHWWLDPADNVINLSLTSAKAYAQDNLANLDNDLRWLDAETGHNYADLNTGEGDSDPYVHSGDASSNTAVSNTGNDNIITENSVFDWPWTNVETSFNMSAILALFGYHLG